MTQKEEISEVAQQIREAIDQLAFQTGIPYTLGNVQGGSIKLHEYCTFRVENQDPFILGVTLSNKWGQLEFTLELAEESSGYSHWGICLTERPEGGIFEMAKLAIENLPKVNAIREILIPPTKSELVDPKRILTEIVKKIRHKEVTADQGVDLIEQVITDVKKQELATAATEVRDYLSKYTG